MASRFEINRTAGGKYHFRLKGGNGRILLSSEMFESKTAATNTIQSVISYADDDARYSRKIASNGKPYFLLQAPNGLIIGVSELFDSTVAMEEAIKATKMIRGKIDVRSLKAA